MYGQEFSVNYVLKSFLFLKLVNDKDEIEGDKVISFNEKFSIILWKFRWLTNPINKLLGHLVIFFGISKEEAGAG